MMTPSERQHPRHAAGRRTLLTALWLVLGLVAVDAQCTFRNTAFKSGEFLSYNLYYNWKFVWVKAGTASMSVVQSTWKGQPAWRSSLITRGNDRVDEMFVLRDTLLCYSTLDMSPLYYRKGAREGKRYNVDQVFYSYPDGNCSVKMQRQHTDGKTDYHQHASDQCVYDMLNIFMRARSFDPAGWKKGHVVNIPIADGNGIIPAQLRYRGKTVVKGDNGVKYRCLQLSYIETEKGKSKEIARFYVTDDNNHVPVRLDLFLRFGSAKAFVVGMKGTRNAVASVVK